MNNITTIIKQHCIAIKHASGNGSGVLMSGITKEYSYVLTARHVLQINKDKYSEGMREEKDLTLTSAHYNSLIMQEIYHHETLDIAIIKIEYISGLSIYPCEQGLAPATAVQLFGWPPKSNQVENFLLKFNSVKEDLLEFSTDENNVQPNDIGGFSGGGLFYISDNIAYLYGVDTSTIKQTEFVTRICGNHISKFEEFLASKNLVCFGASYLAEFDSIQSNTFSFLDIDNENGLEEVIAILHDIMSEKICPTSLSPYLILNQFEEKLLSYRQEHKELREVELWTDFLEFIAIQVIISPPENFNDGWELVYLKKLFNSYRLLYSNKFIGWRSLYKNLVLPSNFKGLKENGRIIIIGHSQRLPNEPNIEHQFDKTIGNISAGLDRAGIDNTRNNEHMKNPIIHWHKLNDICLAEKQDSYAGLKRAIAADVENIRSTLKQNYGKYLLSEGE